jgi:hypothetical protein
MQVFGLLHVDDVGKFVQDLAWLEVRDFCSIHIDFYDGDLIATSQCLVTVEARTSYGEYFLWESFKDGMLHHWGWSEKFRLPDTSPTPGW